MKLAYFMTLLVIAASILHWPTSEADVAMVPGVEISKNTILINITVEDDKVTIDVYNNFTLHSYLDDIFTSTVSVTNATIMDSLLEEPANATIESNNSELEIKYITFDDMDSAILFRYHYRVECTDMDGIYFTRDITSTCNFNKLWTKYFAYVKDFTVKITSNEKVFARHRDGEQNGTELEFYYGVYDYYGIRVGEIIPLDYYLHINWTGGSRLCEIEELNDCYITPEHAADIPHLILDEDVEIKIKQNKDKTEYEIDASFHFYQEVLLRNLPVVLWFPENGTEGFAEYTYEYYSEDDKVKTEILELDMYKSTRLGQEGFYISIPETYDFFLKFPGDLHTYLNVTIRGELADPWFDFVIVTVPEHPSKINLTLPQNFEIGSFRSPFMFYKFYNSSRTKNTISFYGCCEDYGKVHVEWIQLADRDGDSVPDSEDAYPDDPDRWDDEFLSVESYAFLILSVIALVVILFTALFINVIKRRKQ